MTPLPGSLELTQESEIEFRRCFVEDAQTGVLRLTSKGLEEYGSRFTKAGISIWLIKNRQQFRQACNESEYDTHGRAGSLKRVFH